MSVPKKRQSSSKTRRRRQHLALTKPELVTCKECGKATRPHHTCKYCGTANTSLTSKK
ncbi:MAG: 50S ribosomal protein L32 [Candidatus Jacksonbacteria bacterium]|nr:50S ribosomal protein L32 [Candidatus Jacksonbacteria bacterium]MBT3413456.1 50S ribosomal protein L32 [Candidatus Jacksonbacteria bacterium]MBT6301434.1 50S ribosomal protein L32 [Candidatus Jacksonbacteria bacterium]MBT6757613.1 50S ribosomal protein L32 [Candidatus Jacksonbacteria bacterium]MBT6955088.1 50S ribosomal protein L32 [Candidatus Jacksonbacteria bacterium]